MTASEDGTARLWNASSGKELARLQGHEPGFISAAFSPDGAKVVTASEEDRTARLWRAQIPPPWPELRDYALEILPRTELTQDEKCRFFVTDECPE